MVSRWWHGLRKLKKLSPRRAGLIAPRPIRRLALVLERLEDRTVPSFAAPSVFNLPAAPQAVATGHFEGSHAPADVVTANANGVVSVLLGKGDGTLQNPINIHVGGSLTSVAVGDFLGNGLQDIVTANSNGSVNVLVSNGNGTFQAPKTIDIGATPAGVAVGDFLGNGRQDIVTANTNRTVSVLLGNGNGTFGTPITTTVGGNLTSVAVGEFNGDTKADVVVGTNSGLDVLVSKGNGTLQLTQTVPFDIDYANLEIPEAVTSVAVGDFRGGAKQDIVALAGGSVNVLLGNGNGTFQAPVAVDGGPGTVASLAVGDFTGDGKQDIVTSTVAANLGPEPSLNVLAGNGDGTFRIGAPEPVGETGNALAAADFNGDGKLDLALVSNFGANDVTTLLNSGTGTFVTAPAATANVLPSALAAGDFTGNGKQDIVATGIGGNAVVLISNGDGTFRAGPTLTVAGTPASVVVGDFIGNGKQDIAIGTDAGTIDVFLGNGNGTFQAPKVFNLGSSTVIRSMVAGDFNHDGKLDLAVTTMLQDGNETGQVTVLLSNGNGTFHKAGSTNVGVDAEGLAVADLNGDGNLDLVTTSFLPDGSRDVKVLLGNGNGTFKAPITLTPGTRADSVGVGDFNGDHKQDLVLVDRFNDTVTVLPGNGNGTFGSPLTTKVPSPIPGLGGPAVGDFFGDGKISVAVTTGLGTVDVLRGNGDGTFQAPVSYLVDFHGQEPSTVIAGDFNGDGKPDLAASNFLSGDVSVLINTTPPPGHPAPVATSISLAVDTKTAVFGQPVTLTATVTSTSGAPTGTVTFFDGNTVLAQVALDPNGQASLSVPLGTGTHSLRATFTGIASFTNSTAAAVSETINKAATTTTLSAESFTLGNHFVYLTATIAPIAPGAGLPTGTVTFFDGKTVVGTAQVDANGQATLLVRFLTTGKHTLTAVYGGDGNFDGSTSTPIVVNVT
jgi:hypothetical protein